MIADHWLGIKAGNKCQRCNGVGTEEYPHTVFLDLNSEIETILCSKCIGERPAQKKVRPKPAPKVGKFFSGDGKTVLTPFPAFTSSGGGTSPSMSEFKRLLKDLKNSVLDEIHKVDKDRKRFFS